MKKKYSYTQEEIELNTVLSHQEKSLSEIEIPKVDEKAIAESEALLKSLGIALPPQKAQPSVSSRKTEIVIPTWEQLLTKASADNAQYKELTDFFSEKELQENEDYIRALASDFNAMHHMDLIDYSICAIAGILSGAIDILMVGIPHATPDGLKAGPLSNVIRQRFDKAFPPEEMEKLANSSISKVSFDAQDNRYTTVHVEGLSAYYHRMLSLGHDPLLGFIVGVFDIMTGRMTTIDKKGKIVSQIMSNYADRKETNIFSAIAKQFIHFKSDITTPMGLPAPLMGLFNLLQFGSIGEEEQTIAEIVQGMYYEGYDFIHFCSASIPVLLTEVIVRICYAIRRIRAGFSIKESIPFSLNREKHPKLASMLFIAHTAATAINAGKVYFTKNPMAINYPQWIAFAKYSFKELKWVLVDKGQLRDKYISGKLDDEFKETFENTEKLIGRFSDNYIFTLAE
ncbi:MAG: hypothetical protein J6A47_03040 [Bacilli bacterium]|nr:hypothetical protein [Bacilli bacterium]